MENDFAIDNDLTPEIETKLQSIISDVNGIINGFMIDHNFENLTDITQQQFTGVLHYVAMVYFRKNKCLYKYIPGVNRDGCKTLMYDDNLIFGICEYYINLCAINNKVINPWGFCMLIGCDDDTLKRWGNMKNERPNAYAVVKRLQNAYEKSLENGAQSGKNPVGFIATLNHRFGWSSESKTSINVNITRSNEQLMSTYDDSLLIESDKKTP